MKLGILILKTSIRRKRKKIKLAQIKIWLTVQIMSLLIRYQVIVSLKIKN